MLRQSKSLRDSSKEWKQPLRMLTLESRCKAWQTKKLQVGDVHAPSKTKTTVTNWYCCCSKMSLANHY